MSLHLYSQFFAYIPNLDMPELIILLFIHKKLNIIIIIIIITKKKTNVPC